MSSANNLTKKEQLAAAWLGLLGAIFALLLSIAWWVLWSGMVLSILWGWFVAPLFGLTEIGILSAFGLGLTIKAARGVQWKSVEPSTWIERMCAPPGVAAIVLSIGWCVKTAM